MKKNSVSLKEVLTLATRAISHARIDVIVAKAPRDIVDVQETRTPCCQQQRNALF
jgi:hypothetical protein